VLDAAYEKGCTHWDSSDAYGDSEELIGKWCVTSSVNDASIDIGSSGSNALEKGMQSF
jgi:aryl-alcohol dehydrogenase-like predicted oxidoreductase